LRPRYWISLAVVAVLLFAAVWSFYANVVDPHDGMGNVGAIATADPGIVITTSTAPGITTSSTASATGPSVSSDAPPTDVVPPTLVGWDLTAATTGSEAMLEVERLHGKDLGADIVDAWVGVYGAGAGGPAHATLWVSRSPDEEAARGLYILMTDRIRTGNSPFTGLRPIEDVEVEGFALDGMGQRHYYFLMGSDLYWLAVDVEADSIALAELVSWASR
jgi:hypothetical protein